MLITIKKFILIILSFVLCYAITGIAHKFNIKESGCTGYIINILLILYIVNMFVILVAQEIYNTSFLKGILLTFFSPFIILGMAIVAVSFGGWVVYSVTMEQYLPDLINRYKHTEYGKAQIFVGIVLFILTLCFLWGNNLDSIFSTFILYGIVSIIAWLIIMWVIKFLHRRNLKISSSNKTTM